MLENLCLLCKLEYACISEMIMGTIGETGGKLE